MCGLAWKSLGVLELTALPSIKKEHWVPMVQEADALLVWGGDVPSPRKRNTQTHRAPNRLAASLIFQPGRPHPRRPSCG
jgi:hypothetical protein